MAVPRNVKIVSDAFGIKFATRAQMWAFFDVPFAFAGLQQYRLNMTGQGGDSLPPAYRDVTYAPLNWDLRRSRQARQLFQNRAEARKKKSQGDLKVWNDFLDSSGVSKWIDDVLEELDDQGVPFGVELLTSPGVNLSNSGPLYEGDDLPQSLMPVAGNNRETLRHVPVARLMTVAWPLQYRFNHRPAGAPAPPGFEDGLETAVRRALAQ